MERKAALQEAMKGRWGAVVLDLKEKQEKCCLYTCTLPQGSTLQVFLSSQSPDSLQIQALMAISHPGLLTLYDHFLVFAENQQFAAFLIEQCSKTMWEEGNDRARNKYPWKEEEMWRYVRELVDVMGFMQWQGLSPITFSPHSVYITWDKQGKVGNWIGEICEISPKQTFPAFNSNPYKANVYTLGLILLNMCQLEWKTRFSDISQQISPIHYSSEFKALLSRMLESDESLRCDFIALYCDFNPNLELVGIRPGEQQEELEVAEEIAGK